MKEEFLYSMIIEQTRNYEYRMSYDPHKKIFFNSGFKSLLYARNFPYPYGWLKDSGTPPQEHLDVILLSLDDFELGDEVLVRLVGCFLREDKDHKLLALLPSRKEKDLSALAPEEIQALNNLYQPFSEKEGWYGLEQVARALNDFFKSKEAN